MEKISELMDGELDSREASIHLRRLKEEPSLRENWNLYHLAGDAIRKESMLASRIAEGVSARLANEPTVLAPRFFAPRRVTPYALSAAAGVAGVALVAWVAFNNAPSAPRDLAEIAKVEPQLAAQREPLISQPAALASHDAEVEDYLLAHQSVSSFRTMHGSLPYMRAAADESK